jgi:chromosome segregation ATPase
LKTPGSEASVTPLISEINRLQRELDRANESIDDKLDKLEDAGLGVVGLTKKLEDARAKIVTLEDEIARLTRKEERRQGRLNRVRCQKCNIKLDLRSLTSADERYISLFYKHFVLIDVSFSVLWIFPMIDFLVNLLHLQLGQARL